MPAGSGSSRSSELTRNIVLFAALFFLAPTLAGVALNLGPIFGTLALMVLGYGLLYLGYATYQSWERSKAPAGTVPPAPSLPPLNLVTDPKFNRLFKATFVALAGHAKHIVSSILEALHKNMNDNPYPPSPPDACAAARSERRTTASASGSSSASSAGAQKFVDFEPLETDTPAGQ